MSTLSLPSLASRMHPRAAAGIILALPLAVLLVVANNGGGATRTPQEAAPSSDLMTPVVEDPAVRAAGVLNTNFSMAAPRRTTESGHEAQRVRSSPLVNPHVVTARSANSGQSGSSLPLATPSITDADMSPSQQGDTRQSTPPASVQLTSIMALSRTATGPDSVRAVIAGKLRRIGQEVAAGWTLIAIDRDAGTATLRSKTGSTHTLSLRAENSNRREQQSPAPTQDVPGPMQPSP